MWPQCYTPKQRYSFISDNIRWGLKQATKQKIKSENIRQKYWKSTLGFQFGWSIMVWKHQALFCLCFTIIKAFPPCDLRTDWALEERLRYYALCSHTAYGSRGLWSRTEAPLCDYCSPDRKPVFFFGFFFTDFKMSKSLIFFFFCWRAALVALLRNRISNSWVCERVCALAGRERRSGRTTAGLVEVAHLQHAAKLRLHSWQGANGLFGSKCSRISFQGVQYILVTCIRFFFLPPSSLFFFFFLKRTNKPMLWLRKPSDKPPLWPCPTRLIKYRNWRTWTAGNSSLTVWWDCKRSLFFLINVGAFNSHSGWIFCRKKGGKIKWEPGDSSCQM